MAKDNLQSTALGIVPTTGRKHAVVVVKYDVISGNAKVSKLHEEEDLDLAFERFKIMALEHVYPNRE